MKTSEVIKALSKKKGDFKKRYGKDAPDVMYAVAAVVFGCCCVLSLKNMYVFEKHIFAFQRQIYAF